MKKTLRILIVLLFLFLISVSISYAQLRREEEWSVTYTTNVAQTNYVLKSAPATGLRLYITDILISNGATAGLVKLLNGSGGAEKFTVYLAVNGLCTITLATPIKLSVATALCLTSTTVTTHSVTISGIIRH